MRKRHECIESAAAPTLDAIPPAHWFSLNDRVAIITGAAQGIGLGVARAFAASHARVLLTDINPAVEDAARQLRQEGRDASAVVFDVTDEAAIARLVTGAQTKFGAVDIWSITRGSSTVRPRSPLHGAIGSV